ncbi:MAG: glycosyltransferase family 39 protein [Elusimicrobiota bacterium]|nr:glycosyltransferase family 39 protein [Elusimicrobiota bacterium]
MTFRRLPRLLALAFVLGLGLRAGYSSWAILSGKSLPSNDEYETIARRLVEHGRFEGAGGKPTAAREPGFPLFIAALYAVFGFKPLVVTLALSLLGALTALLLREVSGRVFGEDAGDWTFLLALFYPYFVFYTGYFYRETLLCFLLAAALLALSLLEEKPTTRRAAWAGGLIGVAAISFSSLLPSCVLLALYAAWRVRRRAAKGALLLMLLAALPSALWTARNLAVFGRFIPGSTIGGFNFYTYLIVPDDARGLPRENEIKYADPDWRRIDSMGYLIEDDGSQQAAYFEAGKRWVAAHPREYALRTVRQVVKMWRPYPYKRDYQHPYWLVVLASLLSDGWLIPLGFYGLWRFRAAGPETRYFALLVFSATAVYALLSAIVRYRLPLMVPLLACGGAALAAYPPTRRVLRALKA